MIGDAIHNLRGALDHLATGIIRTHRDGAQPYFPISQSRDDLINDARMSRRLDDMEQSLPGSKKLILDRIRPVNDAKESLWSFVKLSNDDKHSLIIPTVTIATISGINANIGGIILKDCRAGNDAGEPFVVIAAGFPFSLNGDPKATVEVSFGPGTPFNGEPVIPTLFNVRHLVLETLDSFERLILS
jgi:hypothetical protein